MKGEGGGGKTGKKVKVRAAGEGRLGPSLLSKVKEVQEGRKCPYAQQVSGRWGPTRWGVGASEERR